MHHSLGNVIEIMQFALLSINLFKMIRFLQLRSFVRLALIPCFVLVFSFLTTTSYAAFVPAKKQVVAEKSINPQNQQDAYEALAAMSNKEIEKLTGKKLTFKEKAGLFLVRHQWKIKSIKPVVKTKHWEDKCFSMYLKNGDVVEVKIIQIGTDDIKYKRCNKPDDPEMVISKADVFSIKDSNGDSVYSSKDENWKRGGSASDGRTDRLALASGITGIGAITLGLIYFPLGLAAGLAAGIMGIISLSRFRKNSRLRGEGWAITGVVAGSLWLLLTALVIIAIASIW